MRNFKIVFFAMACGITLSAASQLTVVNGYGAGFCQTGDTVEVLADPNPPNTVFDTWTSSVPGITAIPSLKEYHIRLIMPAQDVTLTPSYQSYAPWRFAHTTIIGKELYYYLPAPIKGIILALHGSGGSAAGWVDSLKGVENLNFCRYAVAHGYGLFITESNDRTQRQWDNTVSAANPDIVSIYQMLDSLRQRGVLAPNQRMFGIGFSQGSGFCSVISYVKTFSASALGGVAGVDKLFNTTTVPTFWFACSNDTSNGNAQRVPDVRAAYSTLSGRGIDAACFVLQPTPLFPKRFERIPGIDSAEGYGIFNDLKTAGYLNSGNYFKINPKDNPAWINAVTAVPAIYDGAIEDQVSVSFTEHKFYSDVNSRTITFFDQYAGTTDVSRSYHSGRPIAVAPSMSQQARKVFDLRGRRLSIPIAGLHGVRIQMIGRFFTEQVGRFRGNPAE
jgi:hypothetical protein